MLSETSESLLQLLKKKPLTREEIEALGVLTGRDLHNLLTSLVGGRHLMLSSDGKYAPLSEELRSARVIGSRGYARAVETWLQLADGAPHAVMELFKPNGVQHKLCQLLLRSGLCELTPERDAIFVARRERFKNVWDDEVLFCKFFGWPAPHAPDVNALLSGRELTLQEQIDITVRLAPAIGYCNTARRAGWNANRVTKLLKLSTLPAAVREHPALRPQYAHELAQLPNERAMLDWLNECSTEVHEVEEALYEPPAEEPEPDAKEMLATALKLSAATFDMVSSIERKISWMAKELGWKGD